MNGMQQLADIKPYLDIEEHSLYIFGAVLLVVLLLLVLFLWIVISRFLEHRRANKDKFYLNKIKSVDLGNAKETAYTLTYFGRLVTKDQRSSEIYDQLIETLGRYKYKKDVPKFDKKAVSLYNLFVQVLDESI